MQNCGIPFGDNSNCAVRHTFILHSTFCILHFAYSCRGCLVSVNYDAGQVHGLCVCPEPLQVVEVPGLVGKHVDDDGAVVQQLPGVTTVALTAQHGLAQLLQGVLGVVAEGFMISLVISLLLNQYCFGVLCKIHIGKIIHQALGNQIL